MNSNPPVFFKMKNVIQNFPWGSTTSMQNLFNIENPLQQPQAELWMGAHANGCSQITIAGELTSLADFIEKDPISILGERTQSQFGELPYLFKVLAAKQSLSIQVHPNKKQAEIGFKKEQEQGVPQSAANRNYKDANHKPELVFALTPYHAMNGFRDLKTILSQFKSLGINVLEELVCAFEMQHDSQGLKVFFESLLSIDEETKNTAVAELLGYAKENQQQSLFALILKLSKQYPNDIGLFSPLLLNVVTLQPGDAMYLDACTPHAYLEGTAIEIMANSDNVLRAGLTPKHIDVPELVANTLFVTKPESELLLNPENIDGGAYYPVPTPDFKFSVYKTIKDKTISIESAEVLFAVDQPLLVKHSNNQLLSIEKGESIFIPAYAKEYTVSSSGCFIRAYN